MCPVRRDRSRGSLTFSRIRLSSVSLYGPLRCFFRRCNFSPKFLFVFLTPNKVFFPRILPDYVGGGVLDGEDGRERVVGVSRRWFLSTDRVHYSCAKVRIRGSVDVVAWTGRFPI